MNPRLAALVRRVLDAVPVLLGATLVAFALLHAGPGDPARMILGERADEAELARLRRELGLDRPAPLRYLEFLAKLAVGDLGRSLRTRNPVTEDLRRTFAATVELTGAALAIAVPLGIGLGCLAARRPGGALDLGVGAASVAGLSMPVFWLGTMLILAVGEWFPFEGRLAPHLEFPEGFPWTGLYGLDSLLCGRLDLFLDVCGRLLLPALALSTIPLALIARITRAAMVEEMGRDYVRTARAKGAGEVSVTMLHALKNASIPVVTAVGLQLGSLLGGAVLTERIFSWPGVGTYAVEAVLARDLQALQGTVLLLALVFVGVNLCVDLVYGVLDPRVDAA